ncbi:Hypothetical predicted protein [Octopus vulgaris]|uniref:Uncharacterized protein n=1 Tax=Octopus vulgaris TaxID=6645 RepID=A0AA36BCC0_OCTVU|nr:Hypothetical predicted protein [Octopus vulgaris]
MDEVASYLQQLNPHDLTFTMWPSPHVTKEQTGWASIHACFSDRTHTGIDTSLPWHWKPVPPYRMPRIPTTRSRSYQAGLRLNRIEPK